MKAGILFFTLFFLLYSYLTPSHFVPWLTSHSEFSIFASLIISILLIILKLKKINVPKVYTLILLIFIIPTLQFIFNKLFLFGDLFIIVCYGVGFFGALLVGFNINNQFISDSSKQKILLYLIAVFTSASIISVFFCDDAVAIII